MSYLAPITFVLSFLATTAAFAEDNLSRNWQGHIWIKDHINHQIDHVDTLVTVFHTPDNTLRVTGQFSNGLKTRDTTFSLTVFAEMENSDVYVLQMYERVPMTGFGGTEVRYKTDSMQALGQIKKVTAFSGVVSSGIKASIKVKCKIEDGGCLPADGKFSGKPGVSFETKVVLTEFDPINICANWVPNTWFNFETNKVHYTQCDPRSGVASERTRLARPEDIPRGDQQLQLEIQQ